ncbi:MAG: ABC transporter ATP-binding protein [Clostridia bacterium]|nr:ABC transporter ATP-binding protein [Clostridia bacterium]
MSKLLELKNVSLTYQTVSDEIKAIDNLTFTCEKGDFISIIGPSGCGKTSVLSVIAGLITPTSGEVIFHEKDGRKKLGYMLQKDHLFPWRTIEKNVFLPLEINKVNNDENRNYALELLNKYGLEGFKKNFPDELSGGMRQRVALIRTLAAKPDLLLLDEPFSALDAQTRISVCDDVYKIIKAEGKTAILITHDISEAISMSDIIIVLSARPAKVKSIFTPKISGTPLERRKNEKFSTYFDKIWKELYQ